jgi:hypothetical protein
MITELLGLAGSGALGACVGIFSDFVQARHERKLAETKLEITRRAQENKQTLDFLQSDTGFATRPAFSAGFIILTITYCMCCLICFIDPGIELCTFNPDDEPKRFGLLWGLITWERTSTQVYTITTGGVGYALLHPLAFQIGTVITGVNPMGKTR